MSTKPQLPEKTISLRVLTPKNVKWCNDALQNKQGGCLGCLTLQRVKSVEIGRDYKAAKKAQVVKDLQHLRSEGIGADTPQVLVVVGCAEDDAKSIVAHSDVSRVKEFFDAAKIDMTRVRFTAAVRCAHDKEPSKGVISACNSWLAREVDRLKPEIVVTIGSLATKAVVGPGINVQSAHGTPFRTDVAGTNVIVLPMMSPKFVYIDATAKPQIHAACNRLRLLMAGKDKPKAGLGKYIEIKSAKKAARLLRAAIKANATIAIDLETNTLQPRDTQVVTWHKVKNKSGKVVWEKNKGVFDEAKIVLLSWCTKPGKAYVFVCDHVERNVSQKARDRVFAALKDVLVCPTVVKKFWNGAFELTWFKSKLGVTPVNYHDVMIDHYVIYEDRKRGLDEAASEYTGMGQWTSKLRDEIKHFKYNYYYVNLEKSIEYAGADTDATLRIDIAQTEQVNKTRVKRFARAFYPKLIRAVADMQSRGAKIDADALKRFTRFAKANRVIAKRKLLSVPAVKRFVRAAKREEEREKETPSDFKFKPTSPKHIQRIMFSKEGLNYEPYQWTGTGKDTDPKEKKGTPKTDKRTLKHFVREHECPFSKALLDFRVADKQYGTYALAARSHRKRFGGYIQGWFRPTGTKTGRFSSNDLNLQNIPKIARALYVSRWGDAGCLIQLDYSQIELRITACLSGDENLLDVYLRGLDVHTSTACKVSGWTLEQGLAMQEADDPLFSQMRTVAKRVNFGIVYSITAGGIVRNLENDGIMVDEETAQGYIDKFFEGYPRIQPWIESILERCREKEYVENPFGRRRHLPNINSDQFKLSQKAARQAPNAVVQSTASEFTLTSLILIDRELRKRGMRARLVLTVHDSILIDSPREEAAEVAKLARHIMQNLPTLSRDIWGKEMDWSWITCPIVADCEMGLNWRDMVKYNPDAAPGGKTYTTVPDAIAAATEKQGKAIAETEAKLRELEALIAA